MRNHFRRFGAIVSLVMLAGFYSLTANAADSSRTQIAESMLMDIHQATWVSEGKGPHVIYIFFDPNCPYCHRLYESTRAWIKEGKVKLRWIPVGILTATSPGKAAAILGAKDPLKAFYYNEDHYSRGGGIQEDIPSSAVEAQLRDNASLLSRSGMGAVPMMLFRTKDGAPYMIEGSPPEKTLSAVLDALK